MDGVNEEELLSFMSTKSRADVRSMAIQYFLGLTGTEDGCSFIANNEKYLHAIIELSYDKSQPSIMKDALLAMVNLTTYANAAIKITSLSTQPTLILNLLQLILRPDYTHADIVCSILANMSRQKECADAVVQTILSNQQTVGFDKIITAFCTLDYNKDAKLHYVGSLLSNLTQLQQTRRYILDKSRCVVQRLLPFTEYKESVMRRGGVVATLHNCCFETDYHEWLLGDDVDLLPWLLLPLASGDDVIDDDDMEKLPLDLQYLEPSKRREADPDIRKLLLDTLLQLCATKKCRQLIKDRNAYVILQRLHLWETDPVARLACENVVQLLISDDPFPENLRDVDIPSHVEETLKQTHEEVMKDIVEETRRLQTGTVDDDASVDTESDPVVMTDSAVKTEAAVGADAAGDVASQKS